MKALLFNSEPAAVSKAALARFETSLQPGKLPPDYREFIEQYDGGSPTADNNYYRIPHAFADRFFADFHGFCIDRFYRLNEVSFPKLALERINAEFGGRIPADTLVIARDRQGSQILLGVGPDNGGRVYFWDHEIESLIPPTNTHYNVAQVAETFAEFIDALTSEPD